MYFPTAGIDVNPVVPPLTALVISFFTSMAGVSGAFLLLPFQMSFLGYVNPSVSATNQLFNIVAIPSGVWRYIREGRMVWPLAVAVIAGTLPGVFLGAYARVALLPGAKDFKLFAAVVLSYVGWRMLRDLARRKKGVTDRASAEKRFQELARTHAGRAGRGLPAVKLIHASMRRISYDFYGERYDVSGPGVLGLSLAVGVVGGAYGIGGGAIIAPFFVSILGLPVYTVAGAALMGTFVTSIAGVAFYQLIAPYYPGMSVAPDWGLGALFGLGGMAGMYLGAACQKRVPGHVIRWGLCAVILYTAGAYVLDGLR